MWWIALFAATTFVMIAHVLVRSRFRRSIDTYASALAGDSSPCAERADLPDAISAFAKRNTNGGAPYAVRFRQAAEMRMKPGGPWVPMPARQIVRTGTTEFLWTATSRIAPLMRATALDALVSGRGVFEVRLFGAIPIAKASGVNAMRGQLMRYLAELPWAPDAILRNRELRWKATGDRSFSVSAGAGAEASEVTFELNEIGDIVAARAEDRPREEDGEVVSRPWFGHFSEYREFGGYRLPALAEVSWLLDDGPFAYFRCELISYEPLT